MTSTPIGDPRPSGETGPAGDQRAAGEDGPAGDPRPAGEATLEAVEQDEKPKADKPVKKAAAKKK